MTDQISTVNIYDEARKALAEITAIEGVTKGLWRVLNIPIKNPKFRRIAGPLHLTENASDADGLHAAACDPPTMQAIAALVAHQDAQIAALRDAFQYIEDEAFRFSEFYPQSSDGRNTFEIFARKIATSLSALQLPRATEDAAIRAVGGKADE